MAVKSDTRACEAAESCREKLLIEAKVRGINTPEEQGTMRPTRIADLLFEKIMEG